MDLKHVCEAKDDNSYEESSSVLLASSDASRHKVERIEEKGTAVVEGIKSNNLVKKHEVVSHDSSSGLDGNETASDDASSSTPFTMKTIDDLEQIPKDNFHRYCYRHNPDVTCNKLPDEIKMKSIQELLDKLPAKTQDAISRVWSGFSAVPVQHRNLVLQGLLTQCCFPQLSFISQEVSNLIRIDFIATLPMEVSLKILCYLDCRSLCNAAQVSRKWKTLADDNRVWHHMCEQHIDRKCPNCGWGLPLMLMKRAREFPSEEIKPLKRRLEGALDAKDSSEVESELKKIKLNQEERLKVQKQLTKRPWKSIYSERYTLEKNWRKGIYSTQTLTGHTGGVTCLKFNRRYLMTGSSDRTVKLWKVDTGECLRTLTGHTGGVKTLVFDSQKLITGGLDSTIKVWNYHTGQCISTYRGHDDAVLSVDFSNKTIVSGSADQTIKVWHVDSRTCFTLRGHSGFVNCVKIHPASNTVFSASDDSFARMWDLENNQCLRVFGGVENNGHIRQVEYVIPFTYHDKLIEDELGETETLGTSASAASATAASATANESGDINKTPLPDNPNMPTHLLTSSLDNTIKIWEVQSGKCVRTQFGHIEGVSSISADTFRIISGAKDKLIKVWDLQDGKCLYTFSNSAPVNCVALSDAKFAAGLENGAVKLFRFD
ncbi:uncharacterized protein PRCAT00005569001 [Priceomyces carsonii]|uniref:uncharacterized protein n=1 Tax=Priceomyces carsonii TaxID=28549 RepID=UPI002ED9D55D|nr:unnamed protein product [Priceomyces carsonii]